MIVLLVCLSSITVHAENYDDYAEKWLQKQLKQQEKYMDELEADGNLTQEAIDSISKGTSKRKPNKSSQSSENSSKNTTSTTGSTTSSGKGWVYSTDELHVVGLPEGENGYTKPGWYGDVD
ncbi:hypothetical protein [Butyrivibrio sp. INlla18]|uniref:hypothetical protein n=1 Tax=Butyrivibrio sp. INlla18 TaxID=1520806 RepID=UPI00115F837D|nr:hypothetical protein [Butyrivibrio sp. INlla18]